MSTVNIPKLPFIGGLTPRVTAGVYRHRTRVKTNVQTYSTDVQIASFGTLVIEAPRDRASKLRQKLWSYQEQNRGSTKTEKGKFPEIPYRSNAIKCETKIHPVEDSIANPPPIPLHRPSNERQTKETSVSRLEHIFLPLSFHYQKTFGGPVRRFRSEEQLLGDRTRLRKSASELDLRFPSLGPSNSGKIADSARSLISILGKLPMITRADIQSKIHGHVFNATMFPRNLSNSCEIQPTVKSISKDTAITCSEANGQTMWQNASAEPGKGTILGKNDVQTFQSTPNPFLDKLSKEQGKSQKPFQAGKSKSIKEPPSDVEADRQWIHKALQDGAIIDTTAYSTFARTTSTDQHMAEFSTKLDKAMQLNRKEFIPAVPDQFNLARSPRSKGKCYPVFAMDGSPVKKVGLVKPAKKLSKTKRPMPL